MKKFLCYWCLGLAFCNLTAAAFAQDPSLKADEKPQTKRARIGLVLSGGGARGLAHIGVIKTLQELRIPIDLIVGTSMGAVVGGAYASGRSVDELEQLVRQADWRNILADRPERRELSFRRRDEDRLLASRVEFGLNLNGGLLPPAAAGNSGLEYTLNTLAAGDRADTPVNQLPLPFKALATDLVSGQLVVLDDTSLFLAMRASMAVPGLFTPVRVNQKLLVDGGLVRNIGVDVARKMGADVIIAVNVGSPLLSEEEIQSALGVTDQMIKILTAQNVERSLAELQESDVLITPELNGIGLTEFVQFNRILSSGVQATQSMQSALQAYRLGDAEYAQHEIARRQQIANLVAQPTLGKLTITGTQYSNPVALINELGVKPGDVVDRNKIQKMKDQLYGRGEFERIDALIQDNDGQRDVNLQVNESLWARSRMRVGFEVNSDFKKESYYTLTGMHTLSWLNPWGGELRTSARTGLKHTWHQAFNQPLGPGSPWYVEPQMQYDGYKTTDKTALNETKDSYFYGIGVGRHFGNWGNFSLSRHSRRTNINYYGASQNLKGKDWEAELQIDTLDTPTFPTAGQLVDMKFQSSSFDEQLDSRLTKNLLQKFYQIKLLQAFQWRDWAGHVYGELAGNLSGSNAVVPNPLGSFMRLSGSTIDANSLVSSHALFRGAVAKKIGQMPLGLGADVRAGFSVELAQKKFITGNQADPLMTTRPVFLTYSAASVFVSVDTRLGPVYLALGKTKDGNSSVYFYMGPLW